MLIKSLEDVLKNYYLCDNCLGRLVSQLLTNETNKNRGKTIRMFFAMLADAKEVEIKKENLYGISLRELKIGKMKKPKCSVCDNFFEEKIESVAEKIIKKLKNIQS